MLAKNLFGVVPEEIHSVPVKLTMMDGRITHEEIRAGTSRHEATPGTEAVPEIVNAFEVPITFLGFAWFPVFCASPGGIQHSRQARVRRSGRRAPPGARRNDSDSPVSGEERGVTGELRTKLYLESLVCYGGQHVHQGVLVG